MANAADFQRSRLSVGEEMALRERFDLAAHLTHQRAWSERTFGPGPRTAGVCDHIRKELLEIESDPADKSEWIDVIILAFDGAWRAGHSAQSVIDGIIAKQARNEARSWPDWRTADPNKAIEHNRAFNEMTGEGCGAVPCGWMMPGRCARAAQSECPHALDRTQAASGSAQETPE